MFTPSAGKGPFSENNLPTNYAYCYRCSSTLKMTNKSCTFAHPDVLYAIMYFSAIENNTVVTFDVIIISLIFPVFRCYGSVTKGPPSVMDDMAGFQRTSPHVNDFDDSHYIGSLIRPEKLCFPQVKEVGFPCSLIMFQPVEVVWLCTLPVAE